MPVQRLGTVGRSVLLVVAAAAVTIASVVLPAGASALSVSAATSLTHVMPRVKSDVRYSFGGSNTLQLQIERGAPADLFLSAQPDEAQALYRAGRCERPITFATNRLVLIVPKRNPARLRSVYGLRKGGLRLSIGNAGVPIGAYTRRLLQRLGLSNVLTRNRVSQQSNVGQVLSQVAFGGAQAGFVYVTDARTQRARLREISVPKFAQPPVRYQGCVVRRRGADTQGARALLATLRTGRARGLLESFGFGLPPKA